MSSAPFALEVGLKRVLIATDFSALSEKALRQALALARRYGAKVYLAHVVSSLGLTLAGPKATERAITDAWREARRVETRLLINGSLAGLVHDVIVRHGSVWEQLEQVVEEEHIDLIAIGTHGRTGLRKIVLGSVAEDIFRHASCPVLTVGPNVPDDMFSEATIRHVLFPTDLSPDSRQASRFALSAAKEHGARLTVLHVAEPLIGDAAGDRERVIHVLEERLQDFLPVGPDSPYNLNFRVEVGPIDERIVGFAREQNVGLIVLGLHSPDTFVNHLPWLHAYEIICEACCPVVTVRSRPSCQGLSVTQGIPC